MRAEGDMHWCFRDRDPLQLDECQYALLRYENQSYPLIKIPKIEIVIPEFSTSLYLKGTRHKAAKPWRR